jgi:hypothetical protein
MEVYQSTKRKADAGKEKNPFFGTSLTRFFFELGEKK